MNIYVYEKAKSSGSKHEGSKCSRSGGSLCSGGCDVSAEGDVNEC